MLTTDLRVVFENGNYFAYQNPSSGMCIQISTCPNWQPAKSLVVRNLPAHTTVYFYKNDHCRSTGYDSHWIAVDKKLDGVQTFKVSRDIKSFHMRPYNGYIPFSVVPQCVSVRHNAQRAESLAVNESLTTEGFNFNSTGCADTGNSTDNQFSSNWFEPLGNL